ncbi:hypothetical protein FGB62_135g03 [Gracilaria domingensis]|nr:hypothetical protein FGB62_135g03 [Gracilaria domingensis]
MVVPATQCSVSRRVACFTIEPEPETALRHVHDRLITKAALDISEDGRHLSRKLYSAYQRLKDQCEEVGEPVLDSVSEALERASLWVGYAKRWQHNNIVAVAKSSAESVVADATTSFDQMMAEDQALQRASAAATTVTQTKTNDGASAVESVSVEVEDEITPAPAPAGPQ